EMPGSGPERPERSAQSSPQKSSRRERSRRSVAGAPSLEKTGSVPDSTTIGGVASDDRSSSSAGPISIGGSLAPSRLRISAAEAGSMTSGASPADFWG